jgi:hypothetical protein
MIEMHARTVRITTPKGVLEVKRTLYDLLEAHLTPEDQARLRDYDWWRELHEEGDIAGINLLAPGQIQEGQQA